MKVLHILKSRPDENIEELLASFSEQDEKKILLYQPDVDWETLVDDIFSSDKVICWW